ncbi:MAG: hypothetical protein ACLFQV_08840 [Vulcanimicrobiota bacterium]
MRNLILLIVFAFLVIKPVFSEDVIPFDAFTIASPATSKNPEMKK